MLICYITSCRVCVTAGNLLATSSAFLFNLPEGYGHVKFAPFWCLWIQHNERERAVTSSSVLDASAPSSSVGESVNLGFTKFKPHLKSVNDVSLYCLTHLFWTALSALVYSYVLLCGFYKCEATKLFCTELCQTALKAIKLMCTRLYKYNGQNIRNTF